jgi:hypothetical protein
MTYENCVALLRGGKRFSIIRKFSPTFNPVPKSPLVFISNTLTHGRTARGGHGLPKVSSRPAMPSTPWGRASGMACLEGGPPAAVVYPFGHPTLYAYDQ